MGHQHQRAPNDALGPKAGLTWRSHRPELITLLLGLLLSVTLFWLDWQLERQLIQISPPVVLLFGLILTVASVALVRFRREAIRIRIDSEERLRLATDAAELGLWDWDLSTRRIIWTWHHERLFGFAAGEFDGTYDAFASRVHPEDLPRVKAALEEAEAQGERFSQEFRVVWPDSSVHWILGRGDSILDASGKAARMAGTAMDITEAKQRELELRRYQQIVETSNEMLVFVDDRLRYQLVNPAYADLYRTTPEALRGRRIEDVVSAEVRGQLQPHLEATLEGESRTVTLEGCDGSGRRHWIETTLRPFLAQGQVKGVVASLHDLTDLRAAQAALETERAHLEERVAARTAEMQRSEAKLRTIFDLLPIGIAITDPDGRIIDCNQAAENLLGLTREELLDRNYDGPEWRLIRPDGSSMPVEEYASVRALREGRMVRDVEMGVEWQEGTTWLSVSAMPTSHPDYGVVIAFVDITARRENDARARAVIDASPVPFSVNEAPDRITYLNPAFTRTFGYEMEDIPTLSHWWDLAYPDPTYRQWVIQTWMERLERSDGSGAPFVPLEVRIRAKDGRMVTVMASASRLSRSYAALYLVSLFDVTELQKARELAEQAAHAKSTFLAHMSHEIRTPMNGILGLAEVALHKTQSSDMHQDLKQIRQSANSLLGILNDILDQAKIDAGELRLEQSLFDLETLLETLQTLFGESALTKGLDLEIHVDSAVPRILGGDSLRLQQVLSNLLSNALKFTDRGEVRLHVCLIQDEGAWVLVRWSVEDSGIGMDSATISRLFKPFSQGDSSVARRFGGTGLGLSISRDLIEMMGGRLELTSMPGKGSRFAFELRLERGPEIPKDTETPAAERTDLQGVRILVAEDQPINQRVICDMLRLLGAEHTLANNGEEALARLAESEFDAVLMDIQMPTMDGLSATQRIRNHAIWADLPVIALTAGVTEADQARIRAAGLNDLLPKPVTLETLRRILERWLPWTLQTGETPETDANPTPVATAAETDSLDLPGFDLSQLLQLAGGATQVAERLAQFAETIRDDAEEIGSALDRGTHQEAASALHRLKGLAGTMGATDLLEATRRLEEVLQQGEDPGEHLSNFHRIHAATLARIDALPAPAEPPRSAPECISPERARQAAGEIRARLRDEMFVSPALLQELDTSLSSEQRILLQAAKTALDQMHYSQASQLLDPLWSALGLDRES